MRQTNPNSKNEMIRLDEKDNLVSKVRNNPNIVKWTDDQHCVSGNWEKAYERFESNKQEIAKFRRRLRIVGVNSWPRDAPVVELFCGRGNGLVALQQLGFTNLHGVDLSMDLLSKFSGRAKLYLGDCRDLKFKDGSMQYVIVQGGLHHLETLPTDLKATLTEIYRTLDRAGTFIFVEPWSTPFLRFMHKLYRLSFLRTYWPKLDALATMTELEYPIYDNWLAEGKLISDLVHSYFMPVLVRYQMGKMIFVGTKRPNIDL